MAKEDNLSKIERREVAKMIAKGAVDETLTLGKEFKKQTSTAIMAAFGLIIALSWREVITDWVSKIGFVKSYGLLVSAVILTVFSIVGILLVSKWANVGSKQ